MNSPLRELAVDDRRETRFRGRPSNGPPAEIPRAPYGGFRFRGMTLIELLVVISIIVMMAALVLPAAQLARESANNTKCINNLREMGLAVTSYENAKNHLPDAGAVYSSTERKSWGWLWQIIPHSNENERILMRMTPAECAEARVGYFFCPSRGGEGWYTKSDGTFGSPEYLGQTDYAGNIGWTWYLNDGKTKVPQGAGPIRPPGRFGSGMSSTRISDGAGHTILAGEKFVCEEQMWSAEPGPGARLGWTASAYASNRGRGLSDALRSFRGSTLARNDAQRASQWQCADGADDPPGGAHLRWGSAHSYGVNFLFASGKVVHVTRDTDPEVLRAWAGADDRIRIDGAPP